MLVISCAWSPHVDAIFYTVVVVTTGDYLSIMRAVGVKKLKAKLSEYLRAVKAGETLLVTDRDEVIAEIRPVSGRIIVQGLGPGYHHPELPGHGTMMRTTIRTCS